MKRGVLIGSGSSDRIWGRIEGRGGVFGITRGNAEVIGRNKAKEKSISRHGHSEMYIQGRDGGKWHMLPLVDVTGPGIEIRKWVGRWMEIMVEEEWRIEG